MIKCRVKNYSDLVTVVGISVFIAQHATACCCRGCLYKWHGIPVGRELTAEEQKYVVYDSQADNAEVTDCRQETFLQRRVIDARSIGDSRWSVTI